MTEFMQFASVSELLAACDNCVKRGIQGYSTDSKFVGRGFTSWQDILQKAEEPWPDGLLVVEDILAELSNTKLPVPTSRKRRQVFRDDDGDELDLDRFRSSGDRYWRSCVRNISTGPQAVEIFINVSAHWKMDSRAIFWRGATAISLANLLENAGYNVGIVGVEKSTDVYGRSGERKKVKRGFGDGLFLAIQLKDFREPLDETSVVNCLSGWFFRTILFQAAFLRRHHEVSTNMGRQGILSSSTPEIQKVASGARIVVVDSVWDKNKSVELIQQTIEALNTAN